MWLPTPVYERIPQFFFLLGLLFIANGLYLGFDFAISFAYIAVGTLSSAYGLGVFVVRRVSRSQAVEAQTEEQAAPSNAEPVGS